MNLTGEQARLVLLAYVKECPVCGGRGTLQRASRQRRPSGRLRHRAIIRYHRCWRCGYALKLAQALASDS